MFNRFKRKLLLIATTYSVVFLAIALNVEALETSKPIPPPPLQLKYERDFIKSVNESSTCSYDGIACQKKVETYSFKEEANPDYDNYYNHQFHLNSRPLVMKHGSKEHKVALKYVDEILNDKKTLPAGGRHIYTAMKLFNECLDYACPVVIAPNNITIPQIDVAKLFVTMDGQDTLGNVVVRILGRKNNQYILMTGRINDSNLDMAMEKCADKFTKEACFDRKTSKSQDQCIDKQAQEQEKCYVDYIRNTPVVQEKIKAEQEVLLRKFAIK